ncbi:hypothetical protein [Actinoallomurus sp. NPDC052274]|uniref:LppU/SCO3897 family protein n=1 Tax=Actinoallomurus sp. NPDC052274 TaxID=3155420 RepID=UPI003413B9D1
MIATRVAETEVLAPPPQDAPGNGWRFPPLGRMKLPMAAVVGVLLVAFAAWASEDDGNAPATSKTITTPQQPPPSPTSAPQPSETASATDSATPTPTSDPTRKAFEKISAGDCLDAYKRPSGEWSRSKPRAVACGRSDAYLKVLKVVDDSSKCNRHGADLDGELWWSHGEDANEIALCVQRQFRTGDCFLATKGENENSVAINNADLMTSWPCGAGSAPGEYDFILRITAFTIGARPPGGRRVHWEIRGRTLCTRIV